MASKKFINRKDFIVQSTAAMSASLLALHGLNNLSAAKYKMGLQLFTIRGPLSKDVVGTIKKVASIGYEDSETYGFNADDVSYYGMKAAAFKKLLSDHELITTSGHYDFYPFLNKSDNELRRYVDRCIEGAKALDQCCHFRQPQHPVMNKENLAATFSLIIYRLADRIFIK